jgi:5,6,7,8-tetrahydromethanopterin hydro-lyase
MKPSIINKVLVGEALVGDGNEVAHVDLIMGPRGSSAETAFCLALTNQKRGDNSLLAVLAPNLMTKPPTVIFNKVDIKTAKQAVQMFGSAQCGVAEAVADSVKEGVIPIEEANDIFICIGVFIHWDAEDNNKIQDWNYEATKLAIKRAVEESPLPAEVLEQEHAVHHPLAAHDYKTGGY